MRRRPSIQRVLAIDPTSRGFGFTVLEGTHRLVDWGLKDARRDKEAVLAKLQDILDRYQPDVLVLEDVTDPRSRRGPTARRMIRGALALAADSGVKTKLASMARVRSAFGGRGRCTKYEVTDAIAKQFPELAVHRPRRRKPWMSEDERQAIFDAAALVLTLSLKTSGAST